MLRDFIEGGDAGWEGREALRLRKKKCTDKKEHIRTVAMSRFFVHCLFIPFFVQIYFQPVKLKLDNNVIFVLLVVILLI